MIWLAPELRNIFGDRFDEIMAIEGEVYKRMPGRKTQRFDCSGKSYFIKTHFGVGWKEILKNLVQLRAPVLGAKNEWRAIERLHSLGIDTMTLAGFGSRGWNPARLESFIITEALPATENLETICGDWKAHPPNIRFKRELIHKVAAIARRLHENGVNHRDFYLCHFRPGDDDGALYLMDLHRAQLRAKTPRRWAVKDLGSLYFSSMDIGLTRRDLYRFMTAYRGKPLRETLVREQRFWRDVAHRALRLYRKLARRSEESVFLSKATRKT